jgi:hypothetical protein
VCEPDPVRGGRREAGEQPDNPFPRVSVSERGTDAREGEVRREKQEGCRGWRTTAIRSESLEGQGSIETGGYARIHRRYNSGSWFLIRRSAASICFIAFIETARKCVFKLFVGAGKFILG